MDETEKTLAILIERESNQRFRAALLRALKALRRKRLWQK
jgi:hypothetical protein